LNVVILEKSYQKTTKRSRLLKLLDIVISVGTLGA